MKVTLKENRTAWKVLLSSEAGAKLIQWMEQMYDDELYNRESTHETAYRLGRRFVVKLLRELKENEINE